jgi:hypothetical protein
MSQLPSTPHKPPPRHAAPAPKQKPSAETPPSSSNFLVPPPNPIPGGDAIPICVRITSAWLKKAKIVSLSALVVDLKWNDAAVATFRLGKNTLNVASLDKDIQFATRLKIKVEEGKTTTGKLSATVNLTSEKELPPISEQATLVVAYNDCAAAKIGQLFLSVQPAQPKSSEVVAVKSFIPSPVSKARALKTIDCTFNAPAVVPTVGGAATPVGALPDYDLIKVEVSNPNYLADEVFVGFDFKPPEPGLLKISWQYQDESTNLNASAYLSPVGA